MPDPLDVFRAKPNKHSILKTLWPELYAALAGEAGPGDAPRPAPVIPCVVGACSTRPSGHRPAAIARLGRWGPPACREHIDRHAERPGGWPLDLKEHRPR